jgi:hypothetical protein
MDDEPEKRGWGAWIAGVIFAPVLYVLSIGPLVWLAIGYISLEWFDWFFGPVYRVAEASDLFGEAISW